jgi:hypothetical protein
LVLEIVGKVSNTASRKWKTMEGKFRPEQTCDGIETIQWVFLHRQGASLTLNATLAVLARENNKWISGGDGITTAVQFSTAEKNSTVRIATPIPRMSQKVTVTHVRLDKRPFMSSHREGVKRFPDHRCSTNSKCDE